MLVRCEVCRVGAGLTDEDLVGGCVDADPGVFCSEVG